MLKSKNNQKHRQRNNYSAEFKTKVVLAVLKGDKTINEISSLYAVHPNQVMNWKKQAVAAIPDSFSAKRVRQEKDDEDVKAQLYQQIGQLKVELDWLKKKSECSTAEKRKLIEFENKQISLVRQCELLGLSRASLYYKACSESVENLQLMELLDEQYMKYPFYGVKRMTAWLKTEGYRVNEKRGRRLLRKIGLQTQYPKPNLSRINKEHRIYPYLLRGISINRVNQVWSTDITYIRLKQGFIYLAAVIDWHSSYVLSWEISVTMESGFCVSVLESALEKGTPEIFNTDQGSQVTSEVFTSKLIAREIRISMDGRGRALDNIFVERLWRSVKYEEVYLHEYGNVEAAKEGLNHYFKFYNRERLHQSLDYQTPEAVYRQGLQQATFTTLV